jgi:WD40 repeat protein
MVATGGTTRFFDERSGAGSSVYLLDAGSGDLLRRFSGIGLSGNDYRIERIVFSPDGKRLAMTSANMLSVGIFDIASGATLTAADSLVRSQRFIDLDYDGAGNLLLCQPKGLKLLDPALHLGAELSELAELRRARFSPDGKKLALLYADGQVEVRPRTLKPARRSAFLAVPQTMPPLSQTTALAFSADGKYLFVGGRLETGKQGVIRRFSLLGREPPKDTALPPALVNELTALPSGGVAYALSDGSWGTVAPDGTLQRYEGASALSAAPEALLVDHSGERVELRLGPRPSDRLRFDVYSLELARGMPEDPRLRPPFIEPPPLHRITGWYHSQPLSLDENYLLMPDEDPGALAVSPERSAFSIGTQDQLYGYRFVRSPTDGCPFQPTPSPLPPPRFTCFVRSVPSAVKALNYSGDGRYLVALLADGSVRWYSALDGRERLALVVHPSDGRWLLFRPDGLYAASAGGDGLGGWQLNHPEERGPEFFPLSFFKQSFERPEQVSATLSEAEAPAPASVSVRRAELPPLVSILEPADGAIFTTPVVTLKVVMHLSAGQSASTLQVRVDGRPVAAAQPDGESKPAESGSAGAATESHETTRPLLLHVAVPQRDCVVSLFAGSATGASPPALLRLRWGGPKEPVGPVVTPAATPTAPTLRVLAIGVDEYLRPELRLRYPGKDARDLAALLSQQQGQKNLYQSVDVRVLTGKAATKAGILGALDWIQHRARDVDTTVLFFAGHGISEPTTGQYYFLPVDADPTNILSSMLPASTLQQVLASLPGRVLLLIDTCHAGNVLGNGGRRTRGLPPLSRAISELASVESGVVVMAAATGEQASIEDTAWQNGAFAKAVLEGLSGRADLRRTGRVTVNMLDLYVSERVRELTAGSQTPATAKPITIADFPLVLSH